MTHSTEETENNTCVLRSGSQHLRVPPTSLTQTNFSVTVLTTPTVTMSSSNTIANTTITNASVISNCSTSQTSNQPPAQTIKMLNMSKGIREFSGNDPCYTAREYVELCEPTINQCGIVDEVDKIGFLHSHLQPGSKASRLMQAALFVETERNNDYASFHHNI